MFGFLRATGRVCDPRLHELLDRARRQPTPIPIRHVLLSTFVFTRSLCGHQAPDSNRLAKFEPFLSWRFAKVATASYSKFTAAQAVVAGQEPFPLIREAQALAAEVGEPVQHEAVSTCGELLLLWFQRVVSLEHSRP